MVLDHVNYPIDLKNLTNDELIKLCSEIRQLLLQKLSVTGGHSGPNLGIVELTTAIHYVFDTPKDQLILDTSHQCYTHKILTGRKEAFIDQNHYNDVNGFFNPNESEYDLFTIGHTSTSLSLASGLMKARDLKNETNNVIAVIGDGSLSGGQAYEGLNVISELNTNAIIIVNDNEMSIAENHGGYYKNLEQLRKTNGKSENNFFKALGFNYYYIEEGNDVIKIIETLQKVKNTPHPTIIHVHTLKGKGFKAAEENKEQFHSGGPISLEKNSYKYNDDSLNYPQIIKQILFEKTKTNPLTIGISSGTPLIINMDKENRLKLDQQFMDLGIVEPHAIAMASALAKSGCRPIYPVFSSFLQRTYDQLSQDLALNNSPATILVFEASIYGMNSNTHLGIFDISFMSNIPNLVYLVPAYVEEVQAMLDWSTTQNKYSVGIRIPNKVRYQNKKDETDYNQINKNEIVSKGSKIAIFALGNFLPLAQETKEILKEHQINPTIINPKFATGLDEELLNNILKDHELVITLEDGIIEGGFGQKIASFYGPTAMKVKNYGLEKKFYNQYNVEDVLKECHLTKEQLTKDILKILNN